MLFIDPSCRVSKFSEIEESVKGSKIIINSGCVIDAFVKIKPVGGVGDINISSNTYINSGCVIYSGNGVTIGKSVLIGPNWSIVPVNHNFTDPNQLISRQGFAESKGGIIIEDDVWIGANGVILDGSIIRTGSIVGSGSLVRSEISAHSIVGGNPLRDLGRRV